MKITKIVERTVPLRANISNSLVNFSHHTISLVALVTDVVRNGKPVVGVAFDSIGRYGQAGILRERMIPRLEQAGPDDYLADDGQSLDAAKVLKIAMQNEKPGGHGDRAHAAAAIEYAVWDLNAKLADIPAWKLIADHFGVEARSSMPVYAAGGYYYDTDSLGRLKDEIRSYQDMGYAAFKMKIGGAPLAEDMRRSEAAVEAAGDPKALSVDANGRFDLATAKAYGEAMAPFGLRWYEEPGDPADYALMAALAEVYPHPLATGENLFSAIDARNLVLYGGMRPGLDIFQMDPAISYGVNEYAVMIRALEENGYGRAQMFPHGGHMLALHTVVGFGIGGSEAYPGVFAPFGGFSPGCEVRDGTVSPTDAPGFGLEEKPDLYECFRDITG
jgi:L-alanine-DL-glutamate epimerase-like enolase superfamily enzyme